MYKINIDDAKKKGFCVSQTAYFLRYIDLQKYAWMGGVSIWIVFYETMGAAEASRVALLFRYKGCMSADDGARNR